jgi:N utilization substance protein A
MMDMKTFTSAISQIAEEKGISKEKVLETIEMAIAAAYKKDYGKKGQMIKAKLDPATGDVRFWLIKQVVTKEMIYSDEELERIKDKTEEELADEKKIRFNPEKHVMLDEAKEIEPKIKAGEDLETVLEMKQDYGRIAAQTAKQVILQRIREAEKESIFDEYKSKEGELISGIVQRIEGRNVFMDIGKTLGVLPREEQVPGEFYRQGQRLKVFVLKVEESSKGSLIFLSRAYPRMISKLFELEVPEIPAGQIQIKSIAREPGSRSKVAVASSEEGIDPIGAMVGQKGTRVMAVINELGGEKIDIIEYDDDPQRYLANSLSPAKVINVKIMPKNKAEVTVADDQLSLAIGKEGQNVRLAAKLTGWKIDVKGSGVGVEFKSEEDTESTETEEPKKEKVKKKKSK